MSDLKPRERHFVSGAAIRFAALACGACASLPSLGASSLDREVSFDIPALPLSQALVEFGQQAHMQVMLASGVAATRPAPPIHGTASAAEVLRTLLRDSGLSFAAQADVITIGVPGHAVGGSAGEQTDPAPAIVSQDEHREPLELETVVVIGTHIRGQEPIGAKVNVYRKEEIDNAGASTLDQFARQLVENFASVDPVSNPRSNAAFARFGSGASNNGFLGSSFDLHGLGARATLTLVDGHRFAPSGANGSLSDASLIPLAAVEQAEVLADGASAIYGADAVAGVVNLVTRRFYSGAQTSVRYGEATQGGAEDLTVSQLAGTTWDSGGVYGVYEFNRQGGLDASQRDYIANLQTPYTLIPPNRKNSVFLSATQEIDPTLQIHADLLFTERHFRTQDGTVVPRFTATNATDGEVRQPFAAVTLAWDPVPKWHLEFSGSYSQVRQRSDQTSNGVVPSAGLTQLVLSHVEVQTDLKGAEILATGPLMSLAAGDIKVAVGAAYRNETFDFFNPRHLVINGAAQDLHSQLNSPTRAVSSVYGELIVPLLGHANAFPGMERLDLSAAGRWDHYSDFGSTTNPKVGLVWEPIQMVALRGTYGRSFRAPLLNDLSSPINAGTALLPDNQSPTGSTDLLLLSGGNPALQAETSTSYTAGVELKPQALPLKLGATYYTVDYRGRISTPPVAGGNYLNDPLTAAFLIRNPPLALVQSYFALPGFTTDTAALGPAGVGAIFDSRLANILTTEEAGFDLSASYDWATTAGKFTLGGNAERMTHYRLVTLAGSVPVELLNTYGEPTEWKARATVSWRLSSWGAGFTAHYVNSYTNSLFVPPTGISSWTTFDGYLSFRTEAGKAGLLGGLSATLTVNNLADRRPPYAPPPAFLLSAGENPLPFDAANASPLGRFISLQLSKQWW